MRQTVALFSLEGELVRYMTVSGLLPILYLLQPPQRLLTSAVGDASTAPVQARRRRFQLKDPQGVIGPPCKRVHGSFIPIYVELADR